MDSITANGSHKTGFDVSAYERLVRVEADNFWFCARNRLIIWALKRYFPKIKNFLEVGCGTGFVLSEIERTMGYENVMGSDLYEEGLAFAGGRVKNARLFKMDVMEIASKDNIDLIGAFDVLEHVERDAQVLKDAYTALNPGGGMIITVPQHDFLWSYADELSGHVRRYSAGDLKEKIEKAGFKIKDIVSFVSLPMPLVMLRRLVKDPDKEKERTIVDTRLPRGINWILEKELGLELFLIRSGVRMGFGVSLLAAAVKE